MSHKTRRNKPQSIHQNDDTSSTVRAMPATRSGLSAAANATTTSSTSSNFSVVVQKLMDSLESIKSQSTSSRSTLSISTIDLENLIARSQQISRFDALTAATIATDASSNARPLDSHFATLSSQIVAVSERIYARLDQVDSRLKCLPPPHPTEVLVRPSDPMDVFPQFSVEQHHKTLYHTDGNIILAAPTRENGNYELFRVHKSMLSYNSALFASMFTLPISESASMREEYDGLPFVHIPDSASDVASLLEVLYDPSALPYKRLNPNTPILVRGILSLATKYQMDALRSRIIGQIEGDWPTSLAQWDRLESEIGGMLTEALEEHVDLDDRLPEPAAAIRLAIDYTIPSILPAAFYHLSRLDISADWDLSHSNRAESEVEVDDRTARWSMLSAVDLRHLMYLREHIDFHLACLPASLRCHGECSKRVQCRSAILSAVKEWRLSRDPLGILQTWAASDAPWGHLKLCEPCVRCVRRSLVSERVELWDDLVGFIELGFKPGK